MSWSSRTLITSNSAKAASSTLFLDIGITEFLTVGSVGVVYIAIDNLQTIDVTDGTDIVSVTDVGGNVWIRAKTFTNGQAAAEAGATVGIYFSIISVELNAADRITVTFNGSPVARSGIVERYLSGNKVAVVGSAVLADDAADPGLMTISGLDSREYLFLHGVASEGPQADTIAASPNYAGFKVGTSGGGAATNMTCIGERRIFTGTGDSVDLTNTTANRDCAEVYVALMESSYPEWISSKGGWF